MAPVGRLRLVAFAAVVLLLAVGSAEARKYQISGTVRALDYRVKRVPPLSGSGVLQIPAFHEPGAAGTALQTGSGPATLTLPPGVFDQAAPETLTLPILNRPSYLQFASHAHVARAPTAAARFRPGPKASRPASFSFCPGAAANPACATAMAGGSQGTRPGKIRYTAGPNQFGGTMTTMLGGGAAVSVISVTMPTRRVRHVPLDLPVAQGRAYGSMTSGTGAPAYVTTGGVTFQGVVTQPGNVVDTIPGLARIGTGFPFTTGSIRISLGSLNTVSSFTLTGSDQRTPLGAGNITMVAGALGATVAGPFGTLESVTLSLTPTFPLPSLPRVGLVGLAALLVVAFLVVRRGR